MKNMSIVSKFGGLAALTGALLTVGCGTTYNPNWRNDPNDAGAQMLNMLPIFGTAMQVDGIRRGNVAEAVIGQNAFQYGTAVSAAPNQTVNVYPSAHYPIVNVGVQNSETKSSQEGNTVTSKFYTLKGEYSNLNRAPWKIEGVNMKEIKIYNQGETITFVGIVGWNFDAIANVAKFHLVNERGNSIYREWVPCFPIRLNDRHYYTLNTEKLSPGEYQGVWVMAGDDISNPLGLTKIKILEKQETRQHTEKKTLDDLEKDYEFPPEILCPADAEKQFIREKLNRTSEQNR